MNAREHLEALVTAIGPAVIHDNEVLTAFREARNFLSVPEPTPLQFQKQLCIRLRQRADSQHLPPKGVKRHRAYIEGVAGACMALESLDPKLGCAVLAMFVLLCARGSEVVDHIADGLPV